jgi:hypothetical protein
MTTLTATANYLGSAEVLAIAQPYGRVEVRLPSGERAWARLAITGPYFAAVSDEVLIIGNDLDELYVIGVLRGTGPTKISVPGDLAIEAPNGSIRLHAAKPIEIGSKVKVEVAASRVAVRADRLDFFAKRTVQKFTNAYTWVSQLFQLKSGRTRAVADEGYLIKAGRMHVKTKGNCVINSETIHLG